MMVCVVCCESDTKKCDYTKLFVNVSNSAVFFNSIFGLNKKKAIYSKIQCRFTVFLFSLHLNQH